MYFFNAFTTIDPVTNLLAIVKLMDKTSDSVGRLFQNHWLFRYTSHINVSMTMVLSSLDICLIYAVLCRYYIKTDFAKYTYQELNHDLSHRTISQVL